MDPVDFEKIKIQSLTKGQLIEIIAKFPINLTCSVLGIDDLRTILRKLRDAQAAEKIRKQKQEAPGSSRKAEGQGEDEGEPEKFTDCSDTDVAVTESNRTNNAVTDFGAHSESEMADLLVTMEFNKNKLTWEEYVDRMELYFVAKEITDEKRKVALFLTMCGVETYRLINQRRVRRRSRAQKSSKK